MLETVALVLGIIVSLCAIVGYLSGGLHKLWNLMRKPPTQGVGLIAKDHSVEFDPKQATVEEPRIQSVPYGKAYRTTPYAEGASIRPEEVKTIARVWVQSQKPNLELRAYTDRVNESETFIQVLGTFVDQYVLQHEFDVRISRADGSILEGSYVN